MREPLAADDRVKITFDNHAALYVSKSGEHWIVDSEILAEDLLAFRAQYNTGAFAVIRNLGPGLESGSVGSPLIVEAYGGGVYRGKRIRCLSLSIVMDISPAVRPAVPQSSDVHFTKTIID